MRLGKAPVGPRGWQNWSTREVKQLWIGQHGEDQTSRPFCWVCWAGQKAGSCVILLSPRTGKFLSLRKYFHYSLLFSAHFLSKNLFKKETAHNCNFPLNSQRSQIAVPVYSSHYSSSEPLTTSSYKTLHSQKSATMPVSRSVDRRRKKYGFFFFFF